MRDADTSSLVYLAELKMKNSEYYDKLMLNVAIVMKDLAMISKDIGLEILKELEEEEEV